MRHHTGTHVLIGSARRVLGEHVWRHDRFPDKLQEGRKMGLVCVVVDANGNTCWSAAFGTNRSLIGCDFSTKEAQSPVEFESALDATSCAIRSEEHTSELQSRLHLVC